MSNNGGSGNLKVKLLEIVVYKEGLRRGDGVVVLEEILASHTLHEEPLSPPKEIRQVATAS